ncbi:outer membrane beta-barrel protein [Lysobacter tyrosinilyticus]
MRKFGCAALFAACIVAAPAASAGDFFVNGQVGRIELDSNDFGHDHSNFSQGSLGYRWGIGMAQLGLEAGVGKLEDMDDQSRSDYAGGYVDHVYTLSSRHAFIGANARIKPPMVPVYLVGRAGYLGMERTLDDTSVDYYLDTPPVVEHRAFNETDGGVYTGVGVGTTILPLLDIGLMFNNYRYSQVQYDPASDEYRLSDDKRDARSVTVTVEYRF